MEENTTPETSASGNKNFLLGVSVVAGVAIAIAAFLFFRSMSLPPSSQVSYTPLATSVPSNQKTVILSELGKSGESGKAMLKEVGGKVVVTLELIGYPKEAIQPAHIHKGECPGVGEVLYPLTNVVSGKSETTLSTTLSQLLSQVPLAINVHKSTSEANIYFTCGNL